MLETLIKNKVYYKIFDKTFQHLTCIYSLHKATDAAKLAEVKDNLSQVKQTLRIQQLVVLKQIHSNIIIDADDMKDYDQQVEGDGLVSTKPNIALAILTADCVPVLISSSDSKVIGAAHCGWKGAKNNIIVNLIEQMKNKGASAFKVIIGPSIAQQSYEIAEDYYQNFISDNQIYKQFFIASNKPNHYMFDLSSLVVWQLNMLNITDISKIDEDTYSNLDKYPSYRRDYHQGRQNHCNILSTIMIQ